jgi:arylesterase / paraoxonase
MRVAARAIGIAIAVVLIATAVLVFDYLQHGGLFKRLKPHVAGACRVLPLGAVAQDIEIDRARGIAFFTYARGRRGTIMLIDLDAPEPRPRAALSSEPQNFLPVSLSLYAPAGEPRRLFVLSAPDDTQRAIEIFEETATGSFAPLETIRDPRLAHANAIVAIGPRELYVAHDSGASNAFERLQERLFRRGLSAITYFDGDELRTVATGIKRANGIAVSNHGLWLYSGEADADRLRIFDRDSETGALEPRNIVPLGSAPEDVTLDEEGTVWIAAHPKLRTLREHLLNASEPSPTAIYRLRTSVIDREDRVTIPFLDTGERLSAGSVAAVHGRRMLVGSLTEPKMLICELPEQL